MEWDIKRSWISTYESHFNCEEGQWREGYRNLGPIRLAREGASPVGMKHVNSNLEEQ